MNGFPVYRRKDLKIHLLEMQGPSSPSEHEHELERLGKKGNLVSKKGLNILKFSS